MRAQRIGGVGALGAAAVVGALVLSGCGGAATRGADGDAGSTADGSPTVIRLALGPDPIWQWLEDTGTVAAWEREHNVRFEVSVAFDQFAAFVGDHADVTVVNVLDVPKFTGQSDRDAVVIAKYTSDRSILAVARTSFADDLEELVEQRIAVESSLASTLLWGLIADIYYGLDFRPDGGDFDVVVVDAASISDLVIRGDVDACICSPDTSAPEFVAGRLRALYGGQSAAELYAAGIFGGRQFEGELGTIADAFVADRNWHLANQQAVAALLGLWAEGVAAWQQNAAQIVADYPYHFAIETDAEVAWLADYIEEHDWVVPSIYVTEQEAQAHSAAFDRLLRLELLPSDVPRPEIDLTYSPAVPVAEPEPGG